MPDPRIAELLHAADRHLRAGDLHQADSLCERILRQRPNDPDGLMFAARVAFQSNRHERAEYLLDKLLQRHPEAFPARYALADVYRASGRPHKTLPQLLRALREEFGLPPGDNALDLWWQLVGVAVRAPVQAWKHRRQELGLVGHLLETTGALRERGGDVLRAVASVDLSTLPDAECKLRLESLFDLLAFVRQSPVDWNSRVFESCALPWMKRALADGRFEAALGIERETYDRHVMQTESEAHFKRCVGTWVMDMRAAGRRFAASLPEPWPSSIVSRLSTVGFFLHSVTGLAHVRLLADALEGLACLSERPFEAVVLTLYAQDATMAQRLTAAGAAVVVVGRAFDNGDYHYLASLAALRKEVRRREIDALVWVTQVVHMPFAFGMRVAPVQVWWAMKYHAVELPEIDGYLTGGSAAAGFKVIEGREWRVAPVAAEDWFDPALGEEAAQIRSQYARFRVLYGTFGRAEKLSSEAYLDAVGAILTANPDAAFLWTGSAHEQSIQRRLDSLGVADRCFFIGWVNTKLYAQVIDVFLDSFPFPCGFTLYESMAAGKPVLLYAAAESEHTGLHALVAPLLAGDEGSGEDRASARRLFEADSAQPLYLRAANVEEYVALGRRLGSDDAFRARAGAAANAFVDRFLSDRERVARIFADHLAAIARETAERRKKS